MKKYYITWSMFGEITEVVCASYSEACRVQQARTSEILLNAAGEAAEEDKRRDWYSPTLSRPSKRNLPANGPGDNIPSSPTTEKNELARCHLTAQMYLTFWTERGWIWS